MSSRDFISKRVRGEMTKIRNLCAFVFVAVAAFAQSTPTTLRSLIAEAHQNNLAIKAAESASQTTRYMPKQASALPDTEVEARDFRGALLDNGVYRNKAQIIDTVRHLRGRRRRNQSAHHFAALGNRTIAVVRHDFTAPW